MPAVSGAGDRPSPRTPEGLALRHLHHGFLGSGTRGAKLCRLNYPSRPGLSQEQTPSQHLRLKRGGAGQQPEPVWGRLLSGWHSTAAPRGCPSGAGDRPSSTGLRPGAPVLCTPVPPNPKTSQDDLWQKAGEEE